MDPALAGLHDLDQVHINLMLQYEIFQTPPYY